jgi:hypothetical protein
VGALLRTKKDIARRTRREVGKRVAVSVISESSSSSSSSFSAVFRTIGATSMAFSIYCLLHLTPLQTGSLASSPTENDDDDEEEDWNLGVTGPNF